MERGRAAECCKTAGVDHGANHLCKYTEAKAAVVGAAAAAEAAPTSTSQCTSASLLVPPVVGPAAPPPLTSCSGSTCLATAAPYTALRQDMRVGGQAFRQITAGEGATQQHQRSASTRGRQPDRQSCGSHTRHQHSACAPCHAHPFLLLQPPARPPTHRPAHPHVHPPTHLMLSSRLAPASVCRSERASPWRLQVMDTPALYTAAAGGDRGQLRWVAGTCRAHAGQGSGGRRSSGSSSAGRLQQQRPSRTCVPPHHIQDLAVLLTRALQGLFSGEGAGREPAAIGSAKREGQECRARCFRRC